MIRFQGILIFKKLLEGQERELHQSSGTERVDVQCIPLREEGMICFRGMHGVDRGGGKGCSPCNTTLGMSLD